MKKSHQRPNWWQTGFVQIISKLSADAYAQSNDTYLMPKPAPDKGIYPVRSNRVIPLILKTK